MVTYLICITIAVTKDMCRDWCLTSLGVYAVDHPQAQSADIWAEVPFGSLLRRWAALVRLRGYPSSMHLSWHPSKLELSCIRLSAAVQHCFVCRRRLIYYPQSDWDAEQFAIYLTPVASQHSRTGWLRQVSFNVRVHGHDSPSQSIWASEFLNPAGTLTSREQTRLDVSGLRSLCRLSAFLCMPA